MPRFTRPVRTVLTAVVLALAGLGLVATPSPATELATTYVYVAPNGSDTGAGTSASPFRTLARANAYLEALQPGTPVEVRLTPGTYAEIGTRWTYHSSQSTVITGYGGVASFDGGGTQNYLMKFGPASGPRVTMRLTVRQLRFTNASNGLQVINAGTVTLSSLQFDRIGTHWTGVGTGYAALSIQNVSGVGVWSPSFTDIVNIPSQQALVHAIYAANDADNITVHDPVILRVSGDPLRYRNGSDNFTVLGGTVTSSGRYTGFSEWYNDTTGEARSYGGRLEGVSITTAGYDAPLVRGRTACFASSSGTTPIQPCDITDIP